ncbi:YbfB/YjiJ family MFS transporter [Plantactinospora soyae]|uniref:MFS family arabinose efflux permease n=1 Tax=Plantactinospora soyae TaxID=1544732 RepID=A0A927M8H9_9ACTN|nr:YbfB/YjiJ family MFS transporter [Plantactinospora soyae]MBE1490128.1 putative MFS family arabinose efflux permease [Plantactinospora soyae]
MTTWRWRSARLALGTASALGLGRFAYGLVLPAMAEQLRWDLARAGAMTTANGLGYLVGATATAALARRLGVAATFRLGMVLCTVALAATAISAHYPALLAARAVAGFAGAMVFIAGAVLAPTTVYFAGTGLGIVLSGAVIPPLLDQHPQRWPLAWAGLAVAAGVAAAVSWTAARPTTAVSGGQPASSVRRLWPVAVVYLLFAAGYIAYITFLSAYLADRHASTTQTTLTWVLLGLAVMVAPGLWQRPIRYWPGGRILAVLLGTIAGAAALVLLQPVPAVVIVSALTYGATFMAVPAAVTALVRAATPPEKLTSTLSTFTVIFAVGQMAGPWLAGALADQTTAGAILGWTAALCGTGAVLAVTTVTPTHRSSPDRTARSRLHRPPGPSVR